MELIEVQFDSQTGIRINTFNYCICFHVPRKSIKKLRQNINDVNNYGIYFLVNRRERIVYIGQSDNIYNRLLQHNRKKITFSEAYAITYENNKLSKTFIDYLEYYYINKFNNGDGWKIENEQERLKTPNLVDSEEKKINRMIDDINFLLAFVDLHAERKNAYRPIIEATKTIPIEITQNNNVNTITNQPKFSNEEIRPYNQTKPIYSNNNRILKTEPIEFNKINNVSNKNQKVFNYKNCNITYDNGEITLLNGSIIYGPKNLRKEDIKDTEWLNNLFNKWVDTLSKWLSNQWVKPIGDNAYQLLKNVRINSPSFSGCLASASHNMNGWTIFKDNQNRTLDEVYRG
ncbi:MAG: GIY-YIG nuclease family protein [Mycoplasmoidaceae bacterium]